MNNWIKTKSSRKTIWNNMKFIAAIILFKSGPWHLPRFSFSITFWGCIHNIQPFVLFYFLFFIPFLNHKFHKYRAFNHIYLNLVQKVINSYKVWMYSIVTSNCLFRRIMALYLRSSFSFTCQIILIYFYCVVNRLARMLWQNWQEPSRDEGMRPSYAYYSSGNWSFWTCFKSFAALVDLILF